MHAGDFYLKDYHQGVGIDASAVVKPNYIKNFCQGGYCTAYNTLTGIPQYTLERLVGAELIAASL